MLHTWQDLAFGRTIAPELVGNDHARHVVQPFEELAEKAFCRFLIRRLWTKISSTFPS
jgi:hypothetical protein